MLDARRRSQLRAAIGEAHRDAICSAAAVMDYDAPWRIPLHESGVFEDLRHFWLRQPILELYDALEHVDSLDLTNDASVGGSLRPAIGDVVRASGAVADLVGFFARIRPMRWIEMLDETACDGLMAAWLLVESLTADMDEQAAAAAEAYADTKQRIDPLYRQFLQSTQYGDADAMGVEMQVDGMIEIELLLDIPQVPQGPRWFDVYRQLEARGHELRELAARQLGYLGQYFPASRSHADEYMDHAIRLGRSAYPLLAHRASQLTMRLIRGAQAADGTATSSLIRQFFEQEAELINAAGTRFSDALERYRENDDRPLIVGAYHTLAEGPFRRFGSLLVALSEIAGGRPAPTPFLLPHLGDVEDRLGAVGGPIGELLLEFVDRDLRNAGAHANVALLGSGELLVRLPDGSTVTVIANNVYGKTAGMRSALNGVDTAINLTHAIDYIASPVEPPKVAMIESLLAVANMAANDFTSGSIVEADANDGVLRLHFKGSASSERIGAMLAFLANVPMVESIRTIRVIDATDGETLGELARAA